MSDAKAAKPRRGRGEGAITKRVEPGTGAEWYEARVSYIDGAGKRCRPVVSAPTKKEVQAKLDELKASVRAGTSGDVNGMTVGQLLDRWLQARKPKMAVRTYEERERIVRNHLLPRIGARKLSKLTKLDVESLYADMAGAGVGPPTVYTAGVVLGICLNYAVEMDLIPKNPAKKVAKPKAPKRDKTFLTAGQLRALLDAAEGKPVYPLLVLAAATGMRQGELLGLHWDAVDLTAGTLAVRHSLTHTKAGGFALKEPKNESSRRTVTLPEPAVAVLEGLRDAAGKGGKLAAPVFSTRDGGCLDKKNVVRAFRNVVKGADGVPPKVRFHDLRHSHVSLLLSAGQSLRAVASRVGHADPAMTLRVYGHCMPGDDARLADAIGGLLAAAA